MRVRVKLCGLRDARAVEQACDAGADALGFVLAPSPRRVSLDDLRDLLRRVPAGVERIAVFARATRAELERALELDVDALQAEHDSDWPPLPAHVFALPVVRDGADADAHAAACRMAPVRAGSLAGALLLDAAEGGGSGCAVDVERARALAARHRIVLAGGLTPGNVAARIRSVRPFAVDASSGLERTRGTKDPRLLTAFVHAVRAVDAHRPVSDLEIPR